MRLRSVHPGVSVGEVIAQTGFALTVPEHVPQTRTPDEPELRLIREVLDPDGRRETEVRPLVTGPDPLRTPLTELTGVRWPVVQTGMGWVAGPRLVTAVAEAGGLGILASSTMTLDELRRAVREVKDRTGQPVRGQRARRRGRRRRADRPDHLRAGQGRLVRAGARPRHWSAG